MGKGRIIKNIKGNPDKVNEVFHFQDECEQRGSHSSVFKQWQGVEFRDGPCT